MLWVVGWLVSLDWLWTVVLRDRIDFSLGRWWGCWQSLCSWRMGLAASSECCGVRQLAATLLYVLSQWMEASVGKLSQSLEHVGMGYNSTKGVTVSDNEINIKKR